MVPDKLASRKRSHLSRFLTTGSVSPAVSQTFPFFISCRSLTFDLSVFPAHAVFHPETTNHAEISRLVLAGSATRLNWEVVFWADAKRIDAIRDATVVDGELVGLDDSGRPDFNLLQNFRGEASRITVARVVLQEKDNV
jgi:hypothetical protein